MTTPCGRPAIRPACDQPLDHRRVVGGNGDGDALGQRPEPPGLLLAQDIVADQDVVEPAIGHHLGLAELLGGDAASAGLALQLGEGRALVRLDVGPIGDAGLVADGLDAGDIALDPVEIDDDCGGAELARNPGLEGVAAHTGLRSGH